MALSSITLRCRVQTASHLAFNHGVAVKSSKEHPQMTSTEFYLTPPLPLVTYRIMQPTFLVSAFGVHPFPPPAADVTCRWSLTVHPWEVGNVEMSRPISTRAMALISVLSPPPLISFSFEFRPLWQMRTNDEKWGKSSTLDE